jgi:large subunit ribosomal protein L24e
MVVKRTCSFCAGEIEPGTGAMFVKRDGTVFHFCSSSCRKQQLHLGRVGHRFKWTRAYELKRTADRASIARAPRAAAPARAPAAAPAKPGPAKAKPRAKTTATKRPAKARAPRPAPPADDAPAAP